MKRKIALWVSCSLFIFLMAILSSVSIAQEQIQQPPLATISPVKLKAYFFYGEGCPHCAKEKPFLDELSLKYPDIEIKSYETWYNKENADLFIKLSEACGQELMGVPTIFIGDKTVIGFDSVDKKGAEIENAIADCLKNDCQDPMLKLEQKIPQTCTEENCTDPNCPYRNQSEIDVPVIGKIDVKNISLPLFTFIIGFLDGLNPCAFWVLCFLLTLLVYAKSRKKILIIGGIFVFASGLVYFIFMAAWLNFFLLVGYVNALRGLIAVMAVIMGLINIKEVFFFKKGISLTIPDAAKPKLFKKMRELVHAGTMPAIILGSIVLAFTANTFELLCTAGFPAIYTRVLTLNALPNATYYWYLVLYNIIYVIPLAIIVTIFAITMGSHKITEKQGKILKFVGGLLMLILGIILLIRPGLLSFG